MGVLMKWFAAQAVSNWLNSHLQRTKKAMHSKVSHDSIHDKTSTEDLVVWQPQGEFYGIWRVQFEKMIEKFNLDLDRF